MYSVPTSTQLYDIYPKDFAHPSYSDQFNGGFNTGSGEPFYPQQDFSGMLPTFQNPNGMTYYQAPEGRQASAFQPNGYTFDGRIAPASAMQYNYMPPFPRNIPSSSALSSSSPTSFGNIPQLLPGLEGNIQPTAAAHAHVTSLRRARGPNKRPPGTGFAQLLEKLPTQVRVALEEYYLNCCEPRDRPGQNCSRLKHMFSMKHCSRLSEDMQKLLPFFVCPAFIAFHDQCRNAKAGRYDSAERHCKKCLGFLEIKSALKKAVPVKNGSKERVIPVEITQEEHKAIVNYRAAAAACKNPSEETSRLVVIGVVKLLEMMINARKSLEADESDDLDAMNVAAAEPLEEAEQFSPAEEESAGVFGEDNLFTF